MNYHDDEVSATIAGETGMSRQSEGLRKVHLCVLSELCGEWVFNKKRETAAQKNPGHVGRDRIESELRRYSVQRRNNRQPLVPPKPKEFDKAYSMFSTLRAVWGT